MWRIENKGKRFSKGWLVLFIFVGLGIAAGLVALSLQPGTLLISGLSHSSEQTIISNSLPIEHKWQFTDDDRILFAPSVQDGIVFIKTTQSPLSVDTFSQSKLIALASETGNQLWETTFTGLVEDVGPLIAGDVIVTPVDAQRVLRGVNKFNGQTLWEHEVVEPNDFVHGLAQNETRIFAASGADPIRVYAVEPATGKIVWERSSRFPSRNLVDIHYYDDQLYVFFTTAIFVLNPKNGEIIKELPIGTPSFGMPTFDSNSLFINPQTGVWAVEFDSGSVKWAFKPQCIMKQDEGPTRLGRYFLYAPTTIGDNVIVTGGCRKIFALDKKTGALLWEYDNQGAGSVSQMTSLNEIGYVMFTDGTVRGINLETGNEVGRLITAPSDRKWSVEQQGVASDQSNLYITFEGRTIFALGK